jgi:hypothetical protein
MANAGKFNGKLLGWATGALALVLIGMPSGNASSLIVKIAAVQEDLDGVAPATAPALPDELAEFADAPYGVDPVVTGPVSTAFRQQQDAANCNEAVWPTVPAVCFPD